MTNTTLRKSSPAAKKTQVFRFRLTGFAVIAVFTCLMAVQTLTAQSPAGIKTDAGIYPEGAAPALPRAGNKFIDPTFGTPIMRVTDEADGKGFGTAYSYWSTFNSNGTRILAQAESGSALLYDFDPVQFTLGGKQELIYPPGGGYTTSEDAAWSGVDPDTLFIHRGAGIFAFNVRTRAYTGSWDLSSQFPAGAYFFQMSVSRNDDVFAFTVRNADYSVGGYAVWQRSTNRVVYSQRVTTLDEVQIDKTGRFLVVKTGQSGAGVIEVKIVDLQTGTVTDLTDNQPDFSPGHSDNGRGTVIGADNWTNRITFRNLATPHDARTVLAFGNSWDVNFHVSQLSENEDWALVSFYGPMAGAFNGELIMVATDGSQRVMRFAHHHAIYRAYEDTPRANISRDGRYVAFTSNWGGSRHDLFIAQVPSANNAPGPAATQPTPVPVQTPVPQPVPTPVPVLIPPIVSQPPPANGSPMSNASFEAVSGFGGAGGNLNKLAATYYASADVAGQLSGDGAFSYRYNPANNGRDVAVLLDNGQTNFAVINQGRFLEVRMNGAYLSDFPLDLNKTIRIERAGGQLRVWEDAALRFSVPMGALSGPAKFKVKCGGDGAAAGLGINGAASSIAAQNSPLPVTPIGYTPPPVQAPAALFQNLAGFNPNGLNALAKAPAPYYAAAETAGTVSGDGSLSYRYNPANNGRDVAVLLEDGQHTFGVINQGKYLEVRLDGVYQTDFLFDPNKTIKIEKSGGLLKVLEDATLRFSAPAAGIFGPAKFKVKCEGDGAAAGLGINSVTFAAGVTY